MIMYNYIMLGGVFLIIIILLGIIAIRLGDINDSLALMDYENETNKKHIFMIYMAIRTILKKEYDISLVEFCEEYCKKMNESDNDENIIDDDDITDFDDLDK